VHIVMIDISPLGERGSSAPWTLSFDAADLLRERIAATSWMVRPDPPMGARAGPPTRLRRRGSQQASGRPGSRRAACSRSP
jgi:hypothetical protein